MDDMKPGSAIPKVPADTVNDSLWRGTVNAWECDEMGRLELRFYIAIAWQAAKAWIAINRWAAEQTDGSITPCQQHIRFLRELKPQICVQVDELFHERQHGKLELLHVLKRSDDSEPVATFRTRLGNEDDDLAGAPSLLQSVPPYADYRGLDPDRPLPLTAPPQGLSVTAQGVVVSQDCDGSGRWRPEIILGKIGEATPRLMGIFNSAAQRATGLSLGGATVECRIHYRALPTDGAVYEVRSGILSLERRTQRIGHWIVDRLSGDTYATVEVMALMIDLDARKAANIPEDVLQTMVEHIAFI